MKPRAVAVPVETASGEVAQVDFIYKVERDVLYIRGNFLSTLDETRARNPKS